MDEYKNNLYQHDPERYNKIDAGDISQQLSLKKKLNCKPFSYFINEIAFDMHDFYPPVDHPSFAWGAIQSVYNPALCIDTYGKEEHAQLNLYACADDLQNPQRTQFFTLRHFRDIELRNTMFCFDQDEAGMLTTNVCHHMQDNQYFRYDLDTLQIYHGGASRDECLEIDPEKVENGAVFFAKCNDESTLQKFKFGNVNETALRGWMKYGREILDQDEIDMLESQSMNL